MLRRRTALSITLAHPGIYNAVLRSDRFGTGHRLGIQNAPAGGPLQITDHLENLENLSTVNGQEKETTNE